MIPTQTDPVLDILLVVGLCVSSLILLLSLVAYWRRHTRSTLLLVGAFATLCGQSLVAIFMLDGVLSTSVHHLVEHALILVQSVLVLAAVYYARTLERPNDIDR